MRTGGRGLRKVRGSRHRCVGRGEVEGVILRDKKESIFPPSPPQHSKEGCCGGRQVLEGKGKDPGSLCPGPYRLPRGSHILRETATCWLSLRQARPRHLTQALAPRIRGFLTTFTSGFPGGSGVKHPPAQAGDVGSVPGSARSPGEGNDNPLQYSCLDNPTDRGACWVTVMGSKRVRHALAPEQQLLPGLFPRASPEGKGPLFYFS